MRQNALLHIGNIAYVDCHVSRGEMSSAFSVFANQTLAQQPDKRSPWTIGDSWNRLPFPP